MAARRASAGEPGDPRAEPVEVELRFIVDAPLPYAGDLRRLRPGGLELVKRGDVRLHSDVYLDTGTLGLRSAGANLRLRTGSSGRRWVTLKQKTRGGHKGALNIRLEFEEELARDVRPHESLPWRKAAALTSREIRPVLQVATLREEHVFADSLGHRAVVALDVVTYPDGSVERRLEIELPGGTPEFVRRVEEDVRRKVRGLKAAPRGKRSEAIRRLPRLFT